MRAITVLTALAGLCLTQAAGADDAGFEQAEAAARSGDLHAMQQAYEGILADDPENIRALNGLATALAWRGNYAAAERTYADILARQPDDVEALTGLGYARAWGGRYDAALTAFERARSVAPDRLDARKGEAYAYLWSGDYARAEQAFAGLADDNPDDAEILTALGQARLGRGRNRAAAASFDRAIVADPSRGAAIDGRRAAWNATPLFEASAWYGSASNADAGLRLVELAWWMNADTRLSARYDDSLSLDNPALARSGESARTWFVAAMHRFGDRWSGSADLGLRELPDGDQLLYRGEMVWSHQRAQVTLGAQLGDHDLGYQERLGYVGFAVPVGARWRLESNTYFAELGADAVGEWRTIFNTEYRAESGWSLLVGGGAGRTEDTVVAPGQDIRVAHAVAFVPVFGYHRLNITLRREEVGAERFDVAMLGFTYRLARN